MLFLNAVLSPDSSAWSTTKWWRHGPEFDAAEVALSLVKTGLVIKAVQVLQTLLAHGAKVDVANHVSQHLPDDVQSQCMHPMDVAPAQHSR